MCVKRQWHIRHDCLHYTTSIYKININEKIDASLKSSIILLVLNTSTKIWKKKKNRSPWNMMEWKCTICIYACVYMACLHVVVCLSSPFHYNKIWWHVSIVYTYTYIPQAKTVLYRSSIHLVNKYVVHKKNEKGKETNSKVHVKKKNVSIKIRSGIK